MASSNPEAPAAAHQSALARWWGREDRKLVGQRFGMGVSLATAVMSAIALYRGLEFRMELLSSISACLLALALALPDVLFPIAWALEEAFKLLTKSILYLLLILIFYLIFAPVGIMIRILGKDPLQTKLDPHAPSYWIQRKPKDPKRVERQF